MKNFKNIFIAIVFIVGFLSVQSSKAELSYNERRFVEDTKNKKIIPMFEKGGSIRDEWLSGAIFMILGGNAVNDKNKDYVLSQLSEMTDILVGSLLRSKENISDAQYAKIMFDVDSKVRSFIYNLVKNAQQSTVVSAPALAFTFQSILDGALGEPYTAKAKEVYNMGDASYVDVFVEKINEVINSSYPTELTKINAAKSVVDTIYNFLGSHLKSRQSTSPAPTPALTFQSILDGALGNDYASKLKEMYNQMVGPMMRMLKPSDLDPVLNASYPNESAKITAVKPFIDKMYESYLGLRGRLLK